MCTGFAPDLTKYLLNVLTIVRTLWSPNGHAHDTVKFNDQDKEIEGLYKINNEKLIELKGFSTIISNLFTDCDVFEPDPNLREDYEISEVELKNRVKKTLLEIKYRYP